MGIVFSIILARGGFKKNPKEKIPLEQDDEPPRTNQNKKNNSDSL